MVTVNFIFGVFAIVANVFPLVFLPLLIFYVPLIISFFVRRSHDLGLPSWLLLFALIPSKFLPDFMKTISIYGDIFEYVPINNLAFLITLVFIFVKGKNQVNKYSKPDT